MCIVLRERLWELYIIYRLLELQEARKSGIEELSWEAKRKAGIR